MDGINQTAMRDAGGRFAPGQSGNPAGKKPGTRNRATLLADVLRDGEGEAAARLIIDKALAGNSVALRFLLDRLIPRRRDRAIELDLPEAAGTSDVLAASNATIAAMACGEITPGEALTVTRVLDGKLRALKAARKQGAMQKSPSPLADPSTRAQEGRGEGALPAKNLHRQNPPHPPIAMAMGPSLSRSRGDQRSPLPRQAKRSFAESKGRGALLPHLLHSTCISTSGGGAFAARLGDRAAAFS
jgi:hypothetical protein